MKNYILGISLTAVICTANVFANEVKTGVRNLIVLEDTKPVFADAKINNVYQQYISLKTALVNNNLEEASEATSMLVKAIDNAGLTVKSNQAMLDATQVKTKRLALNALSLELVDLFKKSKLESGIVYKQFCPMANGGQGGYWLASEAKIQNPYYGKMMLGCGSVKEEIK